MDRVIVGKGKHAVVHDLKSGETDHAALTASALGRSGTLRAPTIRVGRTLLVGWAETAWTEFFG